MSYNCELVRVVGPENFEDLILHLELPSHLFPHHVENGYFISIQQHHSRGLAVEFMLFFIFESQRRHVDVQYFVIPEVLFELNYGNSYVVIAETILGLETPPPDRAIIGVRSKDGIVEDRNVVDVLDVTYEDVLLLYPVVRVHFEDPGPIVEPDYDELLADNFTHVYGDFVLLDFVFIPEQDQLVLVSSDQHVAQHYAHSNCFLMVPVVGHHNAKGFPLDQ